MFKPKIVDTLKAYTREQFLKDLVAGIIVGIVALPLAIAFAIASGVSPEKGLFTAIIAGFVISAFGGSRVQIGGPTGAFIVIVYGIVQIPAIYSTSLRAGERSGDLEGVLKRFLRYQKMIVALRKRVIGAMVYPAILMVLSATMIFVMLTFVIPKFAEFFTGFGAELPWFTVLMINVATTLRKNVLLVVGGVIVGSFLFRRWASTVGRLVWDRFKLRIPLVGGVLHRFAIMQFTQSLGTLLQGGTPMVPSIEIASQSITNQLVSTKIQGIVQNVREGEPLWRSLESTGVVSDLAIEMIKVGESTGALTEMLTNVSEFYDEEIESRLSRLVSAIEPVILVLMGGVIGVLLYAFYLPLFRLSSVGAGQ